MEKSENKQSIWTPELVQKLLDFLSPLQDFPNQYLNHKQKEWETKIKHLQAESEAHDKYIQTTAKHNRNTLYALMVFLGTIIVSMGILTYLGRVSGDALLFLVGTVTSYVIILIQRLIFVFTPKAIYSETIQEESEE
ncbi:MAG: hypothetical protein WA102_08540 [Candidatus Methanoperedens sp.]